MPSGRSCQNCPHPVRTVFRLYPLHELWPPGGAIKNRIVQMQGSDRWGSTLSFQSNHAVIGGSNCISWVRLLVECPVHQITFLPSWETIIIRTPDQANPNQECTNYSVSRVPLPMIDTVVARHRNIDCLTHSRDFAAKKLLSMVLVGNKQIPKYPFSGVRKQVRLGGHIWFDGDTVHRVRKSEHR